MIKKILENLIDKKGNEISQWFASHYQKMTPPVYSSVDIRYAGYKIAPVDTNLFPAGFNNLDQSSSIVASKKLKIYLEQYFPDIRRILVVAEGHTRNLYYLDNLVAIIKIVSNAGYDCSLVNFEIIETLNLTSASGEAVIINKVSKIDDNVDLILLNNDLTNGISNQLKNYNKIILPSLNLGWYTRRKSNVFAKYDLVAEKFCKEFALDPFFITTIFKNYKMVNFKDRQSLEEVASGVDEMLEILKEKYHDHGIKNQPYVFLKSDMGTYGMGIMTANSGEDILNMNKVAKNKMATIKSGVSNNEIVIQEGIHTLEQYQNFPSEKMIYCVAGSVIAEIDRFNEVKDAYDNLNSKGMKFKINPNKSYNSYSLIAELASLAVCFES